MLSRGSDISGRLIAALAGAGDVAYSWDLVADRLEWMGELAAFGISPEVAATGRLLAGLVNPEDLALRQHRLSRHIHAGDAYFCEYRLRAGDGTFNWVQDRGSVERDASGRPVRMAGILRHVTGRKLQEARLEQLENFDDLTGHFNRARLKEAIEHVIAYGQRTNGSGAYLVVGIDSTTLVNDAFGTGVADTVIAEIGRRLDRCLGMQDVIGRVGGDRFGLLLGSCTEARVGAAAEHVLAAVSRAPVLTEAGPVYITVSIGSVAFPSQASTAEEVMTRGEIALAEAKRAGRDCCAHYRMTEKERDAHRGSMAIGERVQRALKEGRLVFAFQPVVSAEDGTVDYYESLLRMRDEKGAIVPAAQFVPIIEQLGFVRQIDRYVLDLAVEELGGHPGIRLGFNISGLTAADRTWLRAIVALLHDKRDVAERIVVEITETAALYDLDETARFVATLRELGCRVALDDFGAGFTSLRHLKTLAVDTVKIDGSFVRNLGASGTNRVFLRHLVGLANGLGFRTVAECVETEDEAAILRREGVGFLQGYHYGRPVVERPWESAIRDDRLLWGSAAS